MFCGLCLHLLGGDIRHARVPVVALSAGLGWAYAGMNLSFTIGFWVLGAVILHVLTEKGLKYVTLAESNDG